MMVNVDIIQRCVSLENVASVGFIKLPEKEHHIIPRAIIQIQWGLVITC